jgi:hypothetical protein
MSDEMAEEKTQQVSVKLYAKDVEWLTRTCGEAGWKIYVRGAVHDMILHMQLMRGEE